MICRPQHGRPFPWPCLECGRTTYPTLEEEPAASRVCQARPVGFRMCMATAVVSGQQNAVDEHRPTTNAASEDPKVGTL